MTQKQSQERTQDEPNGAPYLRLGQWVSLIHWEFQDHQWNYRTLAGPYIGRDHAGWTIEVDGEARVLSRDEWSLFF